MQGSVTAQKQSNPKLGIGRKQRRLKSGKLVPFLMILPSLAAIAVFVYGFIGWTGYVSLSNWNTLVKDLSFAGLSNFQFLFDDFRFQSDLRNTLMFTVLFIIATTIIGMWLALMVDKQIRAETLFRNIFIFPMALSFIVTGVLWQWILNPSTGVNLILKAIGFTAEQVPEWYTSIKIVPAIPWGQIDFGLPLALIAVVIATVWQMSGYTMAMYLAGLRAIPDELREAARIDGASEGQVFRKVVLPQLRTVTVSVMIILGHISLKIFDLIFAMTGSGAMFVTDVPGVFMFETTFRGNHYAQGAAISMMLLILVSILIIPYIISSMRKEEG